MRSPTPLFRLFGSSLSWALFAFSFVLLMRSTFGVLAIGGSCASGGPYEIAVECPDAVALYAPLSVFGGLAAVAIGVFIARGFGVSLVALAWPILFGGLGAIFLWEFSVTGDAVGLILGIMFVSMGLVPLVIELRASALRVLLGSVSVRGRVFAVRNPMRRGVLNLRAQLGDDESSAPTTGDWALSLVVWAASAWLGVWAALQLFALA